MPSNKTASHRSLPIEATDQMIEVAYPLLSSLAGGTPRRDKQIVKAIWAEMVAAVPKPLIQGLTKNQGAVHQFIEAYIAQHQLSPTYQEIADACGFGGKEEAFVVCRSLERKKIVKRREKGQTRSLMVLVPSGIKHKKKYIFAPGVTPRLRGPKNAT